MRLNDLMGDGQAQPCPRTNGLGRKKGIKQLAEVLGCDTRTFIVHGYYVVPIFVRSRYRHLLAGLAGLNRVDDDVTDGLVQRARGHR